MFKSLARDSFTLTCKSELMLDSLRHSIWSCLKVDFNVDQTTNYVTDLCTQYNQRHPSCVLSWCGSEPAWRPWCCWHVLTGPWWLWWLHSVLEQPISLLLFYHGPPEDLWSPYLYDYKEGQKQQQQKNHTILTSSVQITFFSKRDVIKNKMKDKY